MPWKNCITSFSIEVPNPKVPDSQILQSKNGFRIIHDPGRMESDLFGGSCADE